MSSIEKKPTVSCETRSVNSRMPSRFQKCCSCYRLVIAYNQFGLEYSGLAIF